MNTDKKTADKEVKNKNTAANKGKKTSVAELDSIIQPATDRAKARAGRGLTNEGSIEDYKEER